MSLLSEVGRLGLRKKKGRKPAKIMTEEGTSGDGRGQQRTRFQRLGIPEMRENPVLTKSKEIQLLPTS